MNNHTNFTVDLNFQQQFDLFLESYLAEKKNYRCYPGLIFQHGKRTMLQINVSAIELVQLLQPKPATANNPDSGKDRPEIKGHADEIKEYISERVKNDLPWILGSFTVNVAPDKLTVIELSKGFCIVLIPHGVKLDLTDGQHRTKAIRDLVNDQNSTAVLKDKFPVNIILEENFRQCQCDFRDLAQAKPVEQSLLVSFGEASGKIGLTKIVIEKVLMFKGKTDKINKSPKRKEKLIYTTNYIARSVSCVFADNPEDSLKDYDLEQVSEVLIKCLNYFFSKCPQTSYFYETSIEKITLNEINEFRNDCLLGVSVGLEILGRLLHCAYDSQTYSFNQNKVDVLTQINWSRTNPLWHNNVVRVNSRLEKPTLNISWGASSIGDAVKTVKNELGWV